MINCRFQRMVKKLGAATLSALIAALSLGPEATGVLAAEIAAKGPSAAPAVVLPEIPRITSLSELSSVSAPPHPLADLGIVVPLENAPSAPQALSGQAQLDSLEKAALGPDRGPSAEGIARSYDGAPKDGLGAQVVAPGPAAYASEDESARLVVSVLTPDLLRARWKGRSNPLAGHCYAASEALYHLLGGKAAGWTPMHVSHEGASHWFLKHESGRVLDVTAGQFRSRVPYEKARGRGFLTKEPSRRASEILRRVATRRAAEPGRLAPSRPTAATRATELPAPVQARSALFPAFVGGVFGAAALAFKSLAGLAAPVAILSGESPPSSPAQIALLAVAAVLAAPAAVFLGRAAWESAQYAYAVRKGKNVTDDDFRRFVEAEVLAGRMDGGVARLIKIYRPEKFDWHLGLGYHSSGAIALRPELAATPVLFRSVLAHEFKHYQELKARGPPSGGFFGGLWRRGVSEVSARLIELNGGKSLKAAKIPSLERALREAQVSLNLDHPYELLVVNPGSAELKDPEVYKNLSSGRAQVQTVTTAKPQEILGDRTNARRFKAVVMDKPDALLPAAGTNDSKKLDLALQQLDSLYLLATRRMTANEGAFAPGSSEVQRYRELAQIAKTLSKGSKKEIKQLERKVKDFWHQIASTRLKGVGPADFIEKLYDGLQDKGVAFLSFGPEDPGVVVWEKLLRYWEAGDGGEFRTVRVDLEDGGHIMMLRKIEARVGLWLKPMDGGAVETSVPDASATPKSRANALLAIAQAGFKDQLGAFSKLQDALAQEKPLSAPAAELEALIAGARLEVQAAESANSLKLFDEAAARFKAAPAAGLKVFADDLAALRASLERAGMRNHMKMLAELGVEVRDVFGKDVGRQEIYVTIPRRNAAAIRKFVAGSSVTVGNSRAGFKVMLMDSAKIQNVLEAHKLGFTGEGAAVMEIDTGGKTTHEDYADRDEGLDMMHEGHEDWIGHRTHVGGIVASSNSLFLGMAKAVRSIGAKVFGRDSPGASDGDIMGAGTIALQRGIDVINLSLGSRGSSSENLAKFFSQLTLQKNSKGEYVIVVASAGNAGPFDESISQPSAGENVISVAAAAKSEDDGVPEISFFSSVGPDRPGDSAIEWIEIKPDITAIGGDVVTDPGDSNVYKQGVVSAKSKDMAAAPSDTADKKHTGMSGTSMASPMIAGIAALVKLALKAARVARDFVYENLPLSVKAILMVTARDMQVPVWFQGAGFVDAGAAVRLALSGVGGSLRFRLAKLPGLKSLAPRADADSWAWIERYKRVIELGRSIRRTAEVAKTDAQAHFDEQPPSDDEDAQAGEKPSVGDKVYAEMVEKFNAARDEALPALLDALKDPVWLVRRQAALVLLNGKSPKSAPALLEAALGDADARVRQMALLALAKSPPSRAVDEELRKSVSDPRWDVAIYAAYALARRGDASAVGRIVAQARLADGQPNGQGKQSRHSAVWLLGQLGSRGGVAEARVLSAKAKDLGERGNIRHLAAAALYNVAAEAPQAISDDVIVDLLAAAGPRNLALTRTISKFFPTALQNRRILDLMRQEPVKSAATDFVLRNRAAAQRPGALGELVTLLSKVIGVPVDAPTPLPDPGGLGVPGVDPALGPLDVIVEMPVGRQGPDAELLDRFSARLESELALSKSLWVRVPEHKLFAFSLEMRRLGLIPRLSRPYYSTASAGSKRLSAEGASLELSAGPPFMPPGADLSLVSLSADRAVSEATVMAALEEVAARVADPMKTPCVVMLGLAGPAVKKDDQPQRGPLGELVNQLALGNIEVVLPVGNGGPAEDSISSPADAGLGARVAAAGEKTGLQFYSARGTDQDPGVSWTDLVRDADLAGLAQAAVKGATADEPAYGTAVAAARSAEKLASLAKRLAAVFTVKYGALPDGFFFYLEGLIRQTLSAMPAHKISEVGGGLFSDNAKALALLEERLQDPETVVRESATLIAQARGRYGASARGPRSGLGFWERMKDPYARASSVVIPKGLHRVSAMAEESARMLAPASKAPAPSRGPPGSWWKDPAATHAAVTVPIFSLRRAKDDPGAGKFTDLGPYYREALSKQGADTIVLLPHFAVADESPYAAVSLYAVSEDGLDWSSVKEVDAKLREKLKTWDPRSVDYKDLRAREGAVAEAAYARFKTDELSNGTARAAEYRKFIFENSSWLGEYAEYMALSAIIGKQSFDWTAGEVEAARADPRFKPIMEVRSYSQWLAYGQLQAALDEIHKAGGHVLFDIPMFRSKNSVDGWKRPELFTDFRTRNPGIQNQWVDEYWLDLALWNWTKIKQDGYKPMLEPYRHWLGFGFDGGRVDALHFAYNFGNGQKGSGDEPGEDYVKALGSAFRVYDALGVAEAFEGKDVEAVKHGFVAIGGDWKKVSTHDDPRQLGFMARYLGARAEGISGRSARFVGYALGDEWGDPSPIKVTKDRNSHWRYRVPLPGDADYGARARVDARPQLRALNAAKEGGVWRDEEAVKAVLAEAADGFVKHAGGSTQIWAASMDWFLEEWGRDTFVSLPGLLLATGRLDEAKEVMRRFSRFEHGGLIPNKIWDASRWSAQNPDGADYNTVDAPLWFIAAVKKYAQTTGDWGFAAEMAPVMRRIVARYGEGTGYRRFNRFNKIAMDSDGLIASPAQATWMDADPEGRDNPVTPRNGKAVEINALWYSALRFLADLERRNKRPGKELDALADKVKASFNKKFWFETEDNRKAWGGKGGALKDVVDGDPHSAAIRPNMLFAVSHGGDLLPPVRQKAVVLAATRDLLTPYGLRTLSYRDSYYHATYPDRSRPPLEKDPAYHQGTVWPWLIGSYLDSLAVVRRSQGWTEDRVREEALGLLAPLAEFLVNNPAGSLPEVFDGGQPDPVAGRASLDDPKGLKDLFAGRARAQNESGTRSQAWSVAEVLRVLSSR